MVIVMVLVPVPPHIDLLVVAFAVRSLMWMVLQITGHLNQDVSISRRRISTDDENPCSVFMITTSTNKPKLTGGGGNVATITSQIRPKLSRTQAP